jgi:glycosyltransferase involved in cell wall biosynthesis
MKNILFIAYQFPPIGGAGVRRSVQFVHQLPKFGFNPIVITISHQESNLVGKPIDQNALHTVSPNAKIHRLKSYSFKGWIELLQKLKLYRLFWFFLYPFFWERNCLWPLFNAHKIAKVGIQNNCKIVYTTSSPYFTILLGFWLKKKYHLSWVADIRDPFTDCYAYTFPSKMHWWFSKKMEHCLLKRADHVVVNNEEVRQLYISLYGFNAEKVSTIHNMIEHD